MQHKSPESLFGKSASDRLTICSSLGLPSGTSITLDSEVIEMCCEHLNFIPSAFVLILS
jgi:hypothetical protein